MEAEFHDYEKNEKWKKIFRNMNSMSQIFSSKESRKIENKSLNRYTDVVPYDKTRVKLERYNLNYINASHVDVPLANRKYILTQGPLPNTSGHFWLMVWEQKSRAILMLNNLIECGNIKCHKYWPDGKQNQNNDVDELLFDDVNLKVQLKSVEKFSFYILRTFILYDLLTKTSREILHFHYVSWPDFDLPRSCDSFLEFLSAVRQSNCLDIEQYGPPIIHCSAGIGRSGTVVLVDSCLVMIEKNKCRDSINIIDVLLEIRTYRMGLIQTSDQLRFSFMAIIEGSKQMIHSNEQTQQNISSELTDNNNVKNNNLTNAKIKRSFGIVDSGGGVGECQTNSNIILDSSDNDNDEDNDNDDDDNELIDDNTSLPNNNNNNNNELVNTDDDELQLNKRKRNKEREEKRQRTMETIKRIKRKQKEIEERLKFYEKFNDYFKKFSFYFGMAICIGLAIYYYKKQNSNITIDKL